MKSFRTRLKRLAVCLCCLVSSTTSAHAAGIFFSDSFESGGLGYTQNSAKWTTGTSVSVSNAVARTGSKSLKFSFKAGSGDAWSEQRFNLGTKKDEVYIRYYIYFPSNYAHRKVSPNNNKLIRLWGSDYSNDPIKIGASMASSSISTVFPEAKLSYVNGRLEASCSGSGMGDITPLSGMGTWQLTPEMLGKWLSFEFHFKRDTGSGNGALEFWVDGKKQFGSTTMKFLNAPCAPGYFLNGYLLGWSNSGFDRDTDIFIDDVVFSDTYIGPENAQTAQKLNPPVLRIVK